LKDSPAERSGKIHAGDVILAVDGVSLQNVGGTAARTLLKGSERTKVTLKLKSGTVVVERQRIAFDDGKITGKIVPGTSVGVIDVPSFYGRAGRAKTESERSSAEDFRTQLVKLLGGKQKPSALVLDLRGNPGGFLEEAVSMAGYFVGPNPVVSVVENHRKRVLKDSLAHALYQGPLVVLVDDESASASEVLTGALKDYGRAVVVGAKHTYGKGCVQRLFHLDDEVIDLEMGMPRDRGVVKLTTSVYYSPLGHSPANGGIASDIALKMKGENTESGEASRNEEMGVPEETPVVGDSVLTEVHDRERTRKATIDMLQRKARLRAGVDEAVKKDLVIDEPSSTDSELAQAISIADDLAKLEVNASGSQVSRK
jgi:carboxyl-terminal processing protease